MLEAMGVAVHIGHDVSLVDGADVVVISTAIPQRNAELVWCAKAGIEVMTRGAALASLLNDLRSIVVAGTHGKTTTTSMIVSVLHSEGRRSHLSGGWD